MILFKWYWRWFFFWWLKKIKNIKIVFNMIVRSYSNKKNNEEKKYTSVEDDSENEKTNSSIKI